MYDQVYISIKYVVVIKSTGVTYVRVGIVIHTVVVPEKNVTTDKSDNIYLYISHQGNGKVRGRHW